VWRTSRCHATQENTAMAKRNAAAHKSCSLLLKLGRFPLPFQAVHGSFYDFFECHHARFFIIQPGFMCFFDIFQHPLVIFA
jgi:hypothetical protein